MGTRHGGSGRERGMWRREGEGEKEKEGAERGRGRGAARGGKEGGSSGVKGHGGWGGDGGGARKLKQHSVPSQINKNTDQNRHTVHAHIQSHQCPCWKYLSWSSRLAGSASELYRRHRQFSSQDKMAAFCICWSRRFVRRTIFDP